MRYSTGDPDEGQIAEQSSEAAQKPFHVRNVHEIMNRYLIIDGLQGWGMFGKSFTSHGLIFFGLSFASNVLEQFFDSSPKQ